MALKFKILFSVVFAVAGVGIFVLASPVQAHMESNEINIIGDDHHGNEDSVNESGQTSKTYDISAIEDLVKKSMTYKLTDEEIAIIKEFAQNNPQVFNLLVSNIAINEVQKLSSKMWTASFVNNLLIILSVIWILVGVLAIIYLWNKIEFPIKK